MDKRKSARIKIQGDIRCRMVLIEHITIIDLSLTGIQFTCFGSVDMKGHHRIKIETDNTCLTLKARVVRSTLKKIGEHGGKSMPVYEVAMQFDEISESEAQSLTELIRLSVNG